MHQDLRGHTKKRDIAVTYSLHYVPMSVIHSSVESRVENEGRGHWGEFFYIFNELHMKIAFRVTVRGRFEIISVSFYQSKISEIC